MIRTGVSVALAVALASAVARAQAPAEPMPTLDWNRPPALPPAAAGAPRWMLAAGVRTLYIKGAGYDPFSSDDAFVQFSLAGTGALVRRNQLSLAGGIGLDVGASSAHARGSATDLHMTRVSALVEGRYQPASRLYFFARLAPGLLHGSAQIDDASSPAGATMKATFDTFALDAGAGAAFRLGRIARPQLGAWLVADGGYGWAPAQSLVLAPSLGSDSDKAGSLDLGTLAPRGGFFRLALALSYD
ncbi:MAG TPA: hypothetical protein VHM31_08105 [Polyangia bacterium]|nr:hypothetical protein [Polyangia bacterium]